MSPGDPPAPGDGPIGFVAGPRVALSASLVDLVLHGGGGAGEHELGPGVDDLPARRDEGSEAVDIGGVDAGGIDFDGRRPLADEGLDGWSHDRARPLAELSFEAYVTGGVHPVRRRHEQDLRFRHGGTGPTRQRDAGAYQVGNRGRRCVSGR